jgi:hypothetical protein
MKKRKENLKEVLTRSMLHRRNAVKQSSTITHLLGTCSHQEDAKTTSLDPSAAFMESTAAGSVMSYSSDL